ncbi:MAG: glycoside hydrolase family 19 protein [Burkholderiaceae bacterium]
MTSDQLLAIMPYAKARIPLFIDPLNKTMEEFEINTPARQASFISQIGHESGQLRYTEELASGKAYEGRADLGNHDPGDGVKYKGRGLIQVTGKDNYICLMMDLGIDCVEHPEIVAEIENACRSAGWFWKTHGLNELADAGDQIKVTKRINGGTNGLTDRLALFEVARKVLA